MALQSPSMLWRSSYSYFLIVGCLLALASCDPHPGFEQTESGIFKRLDQFGDCEPALITADYFIMDIHCASPSNPDSGVHFQIQHHNLHNMSIIEKGDKQPGLRILTELDKLHCGDQYTFILPFSEIDSTYMSAFSDAHLFHHEEEVMLTVRVLKTFTKDTYAEFLMNSAQQAELSEEDAIELWLMNDTEYLYEKHGACFIQYLNDVQGDSIKPGDDVRIRYNTFLLDNKRLDSITEMQFNFGKPGQLVGGLQYGLSFLTEGDHARIYLPSFLAFGENGNSSGLVPPHTPLFFDVEIVEVNQSGLSETQVR